MDILKHEQFMLLALSEAEKALQEGEFPVGCIIVDDAGQVVSTGRRINSLKNPNEMDHAEIIALRKLVDEGRLGDPKALTVYSTMEPCLMCFSTLILNGIRSIVYAYEDVMGGGTDVPLREMHPLYAGMTVTVLPGVLRGKSLDLFRSFFSRPDNHYWRDSMLAKYSMEQK